MLKLTDKEYKESSYYVDITYESAKDSAPTELNSKCCYWINDKSFYHRDKLPAIVYYSGSLYWYKDGFYHREDGPACITATNKNMQTTISFGAERISSPNWILRWFYYGEEIECSSQKEFDRLIKLKAFW